MNLITKLEVDGSKWEDIELNYTGENNFASFFSSEGNIHSYPAKAVPNMVNSLLEKIKDLYGTKKVLDPFVGSGTIALEAKYLGLDFYGSDLNPLSILLSKTKSLTIHNANYVIKQLNLFMNNISEETQPIVNIVYFDKIDFWFKEENKIQLSVIKYKINKFLQERKLNQLETYATILLTAFSSTIRSSSLTRNGEFKLYRLSPADIKKFNVNSYEVFKDKLRNLLEMLQIANKAYKKETISKIYLSNAKDLSYMGNQKVDLILTSPPYGDSSSTVAYGQFSKLSLQWMSDLLKRYLGISVLEDNCDELLLGGRRSYSSVSPDIIEKSHTLKALLSNIDSVIENDNDVLIKLKNDLTSIMNLSENDTQYLQFIKDSNEVLYKLIKERVRLDEYRKINNKGELTRDEVKDLAIKQSDRYFDELLLGNDEVRRLRFKELKEKLPYVKQTINRKILSLPRRRSAILHFFYDLYEVVEQTDNVINKHGIQAWIVGHRTVLGKVTIDLEGILWEWFESLNYTKVRSMQRQYSFKRMPHHINSTVTRNEEIKTMMQEHILVVQKK
ncbi:hypothetical protein FE784_22255 [Paenibacillus hemerocallicola]|uniref:site-specific DNA-methyltransferase (cytosine-N(4)-specific) n=1 Tax=Paenibacillus hemerocallicola TaxID=1172614 RepID=A0A5C4T4R8_9BACL|nr:DNA adenine methylase [Paenibacillus hemerocallicola]TNJ64034.1 hypothetical protein FE784_22255 [Paenibacillus hemerocallicola]